LADAQARGHDQRLPKLSACQKLSGSSARGADRARQRWHVEAPILARRSPSLGRRSLS